MADPTMATEMVRLAYRREGAFVNVYMAMPNSMEKATLMASVHLALIDKADDGFERLKQLLGEGFGHLVEEIMGVRVYLAEQDAPEHEKAGRA